MPLLNEPRIVVVGLGYVGLPLAVALADHFAVVGLDIDRSRIAELREAHDRTNEIGPDRLRSTPLVLTDSAEEARGADFYIVTVPTPVDAANRPDLTPVLGATRTLAALLDAERPIIVYESTVYPGVTEEICGPLIEEVSGLKRGTRLLPRLLARADQSGRPRAYDRPHRQGRRRRESPRSPPSCRSSTARSRRAASSAPPRSRPPRPPR